MVDLRFGKYGVRTFDKLNIVLYQNIPVTKADSKNFGQINQKTLGYYSDLEQALNAYVKVAVQDEDHIATDVTQVLDMLKAIQQNIKEACNNE